MDRVMSQGREDQILIGEPALFLNRRMQQPCERTRVREKSRKRLAEDAFSACRKQGFRGGIHVLHEKRPVQQHYGSCEQIQARKGCRNHGHVRLPPLVRRPFGWARELPACGRHSQLLRARPARALRAEAT
jgi:hypothetical protein